MGLSWLLSLLLVFMQPSVLEGRCTWYDPADWAVTKAGRPPVMRNNELYDGDALTAAVSADQWESLQNVQLLVCTNHRGLSTSPDDSSLLTPITECGRSSHNLQRTQDGCNCTQTRCIIVEVTDTGLFGDDHIDLSVAAFRALRPYGTAWDNDGVLPIKAWRIE